MTIAYNWNISETNYETANGFIITAHWQCTATEGEYTASIYSTCSWADAIPTIPYSEVTMSEVLQWVWDSGVSKDATEAALAQQIALQKNPVTAQGTPWSQA